MNNVFKKEFKVVSFPPEFEREKRDRALCAKPFLVLADLEDGIEWKNDFRSIAFIADDLEAVLIKNGVQMPALGQVMNFPFQSDAVGFIVSWREVLQTYGAGCYQLVGKYDIGGFEYVANYGSYDLRNYSVEITEGSVRLLGQYNDLYKKTGINYRDSGYVNSVRFKGFFGNYQINSETINLLKRKGVGNPDIYDKIRNHGEETYQLLSDPINSCHTDLIQEILICANDLSVSDFNFDNHKDYKSVKVVLSEDEGITYEGDNVAARQIGATLVNKQWLIESKYSENSGIIKPFFDIYNFGSTGVCPKILSLQFQYFETDDEIDYTIITPTNGIIDAIVTSLTINDVKINGVSVNFPFTISGGDNIVIEFDEAPTDGVLILNGSYV
jgi:hypothetical protein